jgi:SAM-dependent methyltransferase
MHFVELCVSPVASHVRKLTKAMHAKSFESESYWTERYKDPKQRRGERFDWYIVSFDGLAHIVGPMLEEQLAEASTPLSLTQAAPIALVDVGCGNSPFLTDAALFAKNLLSSRNQKTEKKFVGTDFSPVAVDEQKQFVLSTSAFDGIHVVFVEADARSSICASPETVAVVMDKATLDAVDCSGNEVNAAAVVATCVRSLVPGGHFVSLTCRPTARRIATISRGIELSGVACEHVATESLRNDPVSPSHVIIFRRIIVAP